MSDLSMFDVLVLTEIGIWNIEVATTFFSDCSYKYVLPKKNLYGGVGIFINNEVSDVILESHTLQKTCQCSNCDFESLFIDFTFSKVKYTLGGIYRHPNGNVKHFNSDLEHSISNIDKERTTIILGDINIDLIKQHEESTLSYFTMLLSNIALQQARYQASYTVI